MPEQRRQNDPTAEARPLPVGSNGATNALEYLEHAGSARLRCNEAFTPTGILIGCFCKLPVGHEGPCAGVWVGDA